MTSSESETPTPEPAEPDSSGESQGDRIEDLESKVDRILSMLTGGKTPEAEAPEEDAKSIAQREARAAVQDLQRREAAKQKRDREAGELKALREKVDKITEKAPEEYRRVECFMRWREPGKKP